MAIFMLGLETFVHRGKAEINCLLARSANCPKQINCEQGNFAAWRS